MLETIIQSVDGSSFTLTNTLMIIGTSFLLGAMISVVYMKTMKKNGV